MARRFCRMFHLGRIVPELDPILSEQIEEKSVNPKRIPSRRNIGLRRLPAQLEFAAGVKIKNFSDREFREEANKLITAIYNLKLPDDSHTIAEKRADIKTQLEIRDKIKNRPDYDPTEQVLKEDISIANYELKKLIDGTLEDRRRDWHYYEYDEYASTLYMSVRLPANYGCVKTVMEEISMADPTFKPTSVLDFGSGMGTTIWAVNETWPENCVREFLNVDISKEQQHLCEFLMRGGKHLGENLPNIYHRQYLPTSTKTKFDLVVASFSMLELPNAELRAHTIENLWQKTNDLLVIIERGNKAGFTTINEARHQVLDLGGRKVTSRINKTYETYPKPELKVAGAHVMAPCSHDFLCPRISMPCKKRMDTCRFRITFEPLDIGRRNTAGHIREEFSYVVLRKKSIQKPYYHFDTQHQDIKWPRIVEKRKHSGGQITFKICSPSGNLAETVITKKYGKPIYGIAKSCDWGDVLPIKVKDTYVKSSFIDKRTPRKDDKSNTEEQSSKISNSDVK